MGALPAFPCASMSQGSRRSEKPEWHPVPALPGHAAVEFARRVGPAGHVHAFDVNGEFIRRAQARAKAAGLASRITVTLLTGEELPLADAAVDRVTVRNTLVYVRDPLRTLPEFRGTL